MFQECRDYKFWKAVRCELLCGLVYVLFGCGSFVYVGYSAAQTLVIAVSFGLSAAILVVCVGGISGGVCNPALTLGLLVTRNISVTRATTYFIAQIIGSLCGAAILYALSSADHVVSGHLGALSPHPQMTPAQCFGVEFMATLLVTMTTLAAGDDSKSFYVGCSIVAAHLFALPYTGCGLNPARCLAPAIFTGRWSNHWVYWIGPLLGGVIGGFTYEYSKPPSSLPQQRVLECDHSAISIETCATQLTV
ncbi:hypothetical protein CAPTEDRAFT_120819 [Capitella teleta]|uniref:Aquaporin n=1 Tax=Capitella teleta TaxID=283909 RepID=R7U104_CAPTE|nr:hypothetical protein CAPTEDRAFT_120819 [Capitella teleta]|eukprot:ELT96865.1 hypothetical protein CAPTEDRAFT_120819 [Capitella teleta]